LVLALLPTHVVALPTGSLSIGLTTAWAAVGGAGYVWAALHRGQLLHAFRSVGYPRSWRRFAVTALAILPIVPPTILANFSDEANFGGHDSIIAQLQNGVYPPRYLYEPSLPLRYHYGFDLAGAIVTGLLRLRLDQAIDLLTLALWPCMFLLLWRVGERVGSRRAGLFVAFTVCFAGGWPLLAGIGSSPCALCARNGLKINPPFIHYYFQHPWSLGVPIFCLVILQRAALPRARARILGLAALICSLVMLSLAEVVLFVTTVAALGLTELWRVARQRDLTAVATLGALAVTLIGAKLIGGFFVSGPFPPAGGILATGFSLNDFSKHHAVLGQVQWNAASFGILIVLGWVGLLRAQRDKVFLMILAALSLSIVNALHYRYSWDIVKFGTVGFIGLAIGAGIALSDLAAWADRFHRRLAFMALFAATVGQGIVYPYLLTFGSFNPQGRRPYSMQMIRPYFSRSYPVDPDDARAVSFLRAHMAPAEIVYLTEPKSEPYAIWGGLPTQNSVYVEKGEDDDVYGLGRKKLAARWDLDRVSGDWFERLAAQHVTWVVTDAADVAINIALDSRGHGRQVVLVAQYGRVRVFHLE
jgi:hypothetical protein